MTPPLPPPLSRHGSDEVKRGRSRTRMVAHTAEALARGPVLTRATYQREGLGTA